MTNLTVVPDLAPDADVLQLISAAQARRYSCIPLRKQDSRLLVAMSRPTDLSAVRDLEFLTGMPIQPVFARQESIERAIDEHYFPSSVPAVIPSEAPADVPPEPAPAIKIQKLIFEEAAAQGASDIHIEPGERFTRLRYRVDGILKEAAEIPRWLHENLVTRIKLLASLDISERRLPQDGHLRLECGRLDARVSTLPTRRGEKVVVRLLQRDRPLLALRQLGLPANLEERLRALIHRSQGILLVVGPTGCGKTTTLYALINEIRGAGLNIVTIEDPVEYEADQINQVQVNEKAGLTFSAALRSILRQDPDVILVGEIRDRDTAQTAFQAALTGHLVLSTLHATDAIAAVTRLAELGVDRYLISSATIGVIAQRLIRLNCTDCLASDFPFLFYFERLGIAESDQPRLRRSTGCDHCKFGRSRGRAAIFEFIDVGPTIREAIVSGSETALRAASQESGFVPLIHQAIERVLAGDVSIEEAYRAGYFGDSPWK